ERLKNEQESLSSLRTENKILKDNYKTIYNENNKLKAHNANVSNQLSKKDSLILLLQSKNDENVKELKDLLQKKVKDKQDLKEKIINLKKEISQYHTALGSVTNYRINDNDKNHHIQLQNDILDLQYLLKNYVTTLKGDFEINFNAVNDLMEKYNIKTKVSPNKPNKPLIKADLQHHT